MRRAEVNPGRKPIIVRALNQQQNPVVDQWTLKGDYRAYYQSDVSSLIAQYIAEGTVSDDAVQNSKLRQNIGEVRSWISRTMTSEEFPSAERLLSDDYKSLGDFIDRNIDLEVIENENRAAGSVASGVVKLLAFSKFLTHRTYLTYIKCPTEDLAFDMFQSLNATGTPLTAVEVFKPLAVNTLGSNYGTSQVKRYFDEAEKYFDDFKSSDEKGKITDEVLLRFAMIYNGREVGGRFSSQRDWLFQSFGSCTSLGKQETFVEWLANICHYWKHIYRKRKPRKDASNFELVSHLINLGMPATNADMTALCIFFLKDAGHAMAHYVLAVFYGRLFRSRTESEKKYAADEFTRVAKACAAFYVFWQGAISGFPDEVYRQLFQNTVNLSVADGEINQNHKFVIDHFLNALKSREVFSHSDEMWSREHWVESASVKLGYSRKQVCRFSLLMAFHDTAPDTTLGKEGLIVKGSPGSATYLTCQQFYNSELEVLEHIANQKKPKKPYTYAEPDAELYPGDTSVVDRIGNLTLWSRAANSSTYSEWPDKCFYYATLTSLTPTTQVDIEDLKTRLKIKQVPPGVAEISSPAPYQAHLASIVLKGSKGQVWNKVAVEERSQNLCEHIYLRLMEWLSS